MYTHIHKYKYYSTMRKKEILPFATPWMNLEDSVPSEIGLTEKDKCYIISLIWGI